MKHNKISNTTSKPIIGNNLSKCKTCTLIWLLHTSISVIESNVDAHFTFSYHVISFHFKISFGLFFRRLLLSFISFLLSSHIEHQIWYKSKCLPKFFDASFVTSRFKSFDSEHNDVPLGRIMDTWLRICWMARWFEYNIYRNKFIYNWNWRRIFGCSHHSTEHRTNLI